MYKLVVFVPIEHEEKVRTALAAAGAGKFQKYDNCFFKTKGLGHFRPLQGSNPHIGEQGKIATVEEYKLETIVQEKDLPNVMRALKKSHPYEEIAFDIIPTRNDEFRHLIK